MPTILTPRLRLISCSLQLIDAILAGDDALADYLNVEVPANWSNFGLPIFEFARDKIISHPDDEIWYTYLPILTETNTLIGSCGYKGKPDEAGVVEIGYEVSVQQRGKGYATEIATHLVQHALQHPDVIKVWAHTLPENNPSALILEKIGFQKIAEVTDIEDGEIWRWAFLNGN